MNYMQTQPLITPEDQKKSMYMGLLKAALSNMAAPPTPYKRSFGQQVAPGIMQGMGEMERYQDMIRNHRLNDIKHTEWDKGRQRESAFNTKMAGIANPTLMDYIGAYNTTDQADKGAEIRKLLKAPEPAKFDINYDFDSGKGYVTNPNDPNFFKVRDITKRPDKDGGSGGGYGEADKGYRLWKGMADTNAMKQLFANDITMQDKLAEIMAEPDPDRRALLEAGIHRELTPQQKEQLGRLSEEYLRGAPQAIWDKHIEIKNSPRNVNPDPLGLR